MRSNATFVRREREHSNLDRVNETLTDFNPHFPAIWWTSLPPSKTVLHNRAFEEMPKNRSSTMQSVAGYRKQETGQIKCGMTALIRMFPAIGWPILPTNNTLLYSRASKGMPNNRSSTMQSVASAVAADCAIVTCHKSDPSQAQ